MNQSEKNYLSVTETNELVKSVLEGTMAYWLRIRGEISSLKVYPSATYFDIKDDRSVLNCIMWNSSYANLSFRPKVGDLVDLEGKINVYVARGRYSFIARTMLPAGQGDALLRLEQLKKKLASEGLFDESRKRSIPSFPKSIGIICARDSAALSDLIKNLGRRWPYADLFFFPSLVQGSEASSSLLKAFKLSQKYDLDTLIIARGGGSNEDLSAFNDETLVRNVSQSKMPVISAVGHEIDVTLIDYVSDLRVSTPTGAAEAATPNQEDIFAFIADSESRILSSLKRAIDAREEKVRLLSSRSFFSHPEDLYAPLARNIQSLQDRLSVSIAGYLNRKSDKVEALQNHLSALSPYSVLQRGYSIVRDENGDILKSAKSLQKGQRLKTTLKDGIISSVIEDVRHE